MKFKRFISFMLSAVMITSSANVTFADNFKMAESIKANGELSVIKSLNNEVTADDVVSEEGLDISAYEKSSTDMAYPVEGGNIYYNSDGEITDCDESVTSTIIPSEIDGVTITSIGYKAFYNCGSLTSITIPNGVTSINGSAFYDCDSLTRITIPNSVTSIGRDAFSNCDSLTNIIIPSSVTSMGDPFSTFSDCPNLKTAGPIGSGCNIEFGWTESIPRCAFEGCGSLTSITIPIGVTSIEGSAFDGCSSLTSITIPNSVTSIGRFAFSDCDSLTNITIPNSVTSINRGAFSGCKSLTSITIPNSVTYIGEFAFEMCNSLTTVELSNSISDINDYTFSYCKSLENIKIPKGVVKIGLNAFDRCEKLNHVEIPDSVTVIGDSAFGSCESLKDIEIPNSVESIGYFAFNLCKGLTSIKIPSSVTSIGDGAFSFCESLTNIDLPNSITKIISGTFHGCSSLNNVIIPSGVTSIGDNAFVWCKDLTNITIPSSVTSIGDNVFYETPNVIINCYRASYAETYAKENNIPYVLIGDSDSDNVDDITSVTIEEVYPKNSASTIMRGGTALRYYKATDINGKSITNKLIYYSVKDDDVKFSRTDDKGIFAIEILTDKTQSYTIKTYQSTKALRTADILPNGFTVEVTEPEHTYKSVFNAAVSGKIGVGYGVEYALAELKLAEVSLNGELGRKLSLAFDDKYNGTNLSIDVQVPAKLGINLDIGPNVSFVDKYAPEMEVKVNEKTEYGQNRGYTLKFEDFFNKNNPSYYKNGAMAFMAIASGISDSMCWSAMTKRIYEELGDKLDINGGSKMLLNDERNIKLNVGGSIEISGGKIFEKVVPTATLVSGQFEQVHSYKAEAPLNPNDDSEQSASSSITTKFDSDFLEFGLKNNLSSENKTHKPDKDNKISTSFDIVSLFNQEIECIKEIETKFTPKGDVKKVELSTKALGDNKIQPKLSLYDENIYNKVKFILENDNLNEAILKNETIKSLVDGNVAWLNDDKYTEAFKGLNDNDNYIGVDISKEEEKVTEISPDFGAAAGFLVGLGATLKWIDSKEYKTQNGVVNKDNAFVTADYSNVSYENKYGVLDVLNVAADGTLNFVKDMFNEAVGKVSNGVQNGYAYVKGAVGNWWVKVTGVKKSGGRTIAYSYNEEDLLSNNSTEAGYMKTVGNPYIVEVYDENDNIVNDFTGKDITLRLNYNEDDLQGCEASELNIYYWNRDLSAYIKLNSNVNVENKAVSANICKNGEYILGVDSKGPEISDITISNDAKEIYANLFDEIGGVNADSISITVDDVVIENGKNAQIVFNVYTGHLECVLNNALSNGTHKITIKAMDNNSNWSINEAVLSVGDITESTTESTTIVTESTTESTTVTETTSKLTTETTTQATTVTEATTQVTTVTETTTQVITEITTDKTSTTEAITETTTNNTTETTTKKYTDDNDDETESRNIRSGGKSSHKAAATAVTEAETQTSSVISADVKVTIGSNKVVIGDNSYTMDAAPYIQASSNSTMVPLRFVAIAILGGDVEDADTGSVIKWDASKKTATITSGGKVIEFTSGSNIINIDGKAVPMENGVMAEIKDSRMYVPFRALGNALGVNVDWDTKTKTAIYKIK